jgi:GMP synthase (glutamine-hydrolysing)
MAEIHDQFDTILILDFGSQVRWLWLCCPGVPISAFGCAVQPSDHSEVSRAQCICRAHAMYPEDQGPRMEAEWCALLIFLCCRRAPYRYFEGVILSGSPYSVYDRDSPHVDPDVFELGVPVLGICFGLQVCAQIRFRIIQLTKKNRWILKKKLGWTTPGNRVESRRHGCQVRAPRIWLCARADQ